jgi:hypothetical protein
MHNLEDLNLVLFGLVVGGALGLGIHLVIRGFVSLVKSVIRKF